MFPITMLCIALFVLLYCVAVTAQHADTMASKQDPSPCTLVWPKFGGIYPVNDFVYFMFFCKLPEQHAAMLLEEKGNIHIEWSALQYNGSTGDFDFLRSGLERVYVNPESGTISRDFKFRLFQKAVGSNILSMKFTMRVFVASELIGSMSTVVVPGDDALLSKLIEQDTHLGSCTNNKNDLTCEQSSQSPSHFDFIEIGTSGFDTLIEAASDSLRGLSVEPLKHLQDTLPNRNNVKKVSCAIGDEPGWKDIYYLPTYFMEFNGIDLKDYSEAQFLYGLGRIGEMSQDVVNRFGSTGYMPPYLLYVKRTLVPMKTVAQIYSEHAVNGVTLLKLDCEGFDYRIMLAAFDFYESSNISFPIIIEFENNSDYRAASVVVERLLSLGYMVYSFFYGVKDIVHNSSLKAPHGVIYAEIAPHKRAAQDEAKINAVSDIIPGDLLRGREHCLRYYGERSSILSSYNGEENRFCNILVSPTDEILSVSDKFTVL